jgi:hypothetical protein
MDGRSPSGQRGYVRFPPLFSPLRLFFFLFWHSSVCSEANYTLPSQLNRQISIPLASHIQKALQCFGVYVSPDEGAYGSLFCVASSEFKPEMSGEYFVPDSKAGTKIGKPSKSAADGELAVKLWEWSERELKGKGFIS